MLFVNINYVWITWTDSEIRQHQIRILCLRLEQYILGFQVCSAVSCQPNPSLSLVTHLGGRYPDRASI